MKIRLLLNCEHSLMNLNEDNRTMDCLNEFFNFVQNNIFDFQAVPKLDEHIHIKDVIRLWSKTQEKDQDKAEFKYNTVTKILLWEYKVIKVTHHFFFTDIDCTDLFYRET